MKYGGLGFENQASNIQSRVELAKLDIPPCEHFPRFGGCPPASSSTQRPA